MYLSDCDCMYVSASLFLSVSVFFCLCLSVCLCLYMCVCVCICLCVRVLVLLNPVLSSPRGKRPNHNGTPPQQATALTFRHIMPFHCVGLKLSERSVFSPLLSHFAWSASTAKTNFVLYCIQGRIYRLKTCLGVLDFGRVSHLLWAYIYA